MIEIRDLLMVREIADVGNLTKAAHNLSLTQSAVSQRLKMIESRLGLTLFSRDHKAMTLTPTGRKVLETTEIIEAQIKRLEWEINLSKKNYRETLTFSTECYTSYHWLSDFIGSLDESTRQRFEPIVLSHCTRNPIPSLLSGQLDFAVVTGKNVPGLNYATLFDDELVAISSSKHRWRSLKELSPNDFAGENLFEYNTERKNLDAYKLFFDIESIYPKWTTKIELTEAIIQLVKADMGVAILSKWAILPYIKDHRLKFFRLTAKGVYRKWYLCYRLDLNKEKASLINSFAPKLRFFLKDSYLAVAHGSSS